MMPRSAPLMPKRCRVLFGLLGPVTQPVIDVGDPPIAASGGGAGAAGAATGCGAFGGGWLFLPGGLGEGITAACFCMGALRGTAFRKADISGPRLGSGARSFAPIGLRPSGSQGRVG